MVKRSDTHQVMGFAALNPSCVLVANFPYENCTVYRPTNRSAKYAMVLR
jgi:hypothetical protein